MKALAILLVLAVTIAPTQVRAAGACNTIAASAPMDASMTEILSAGTYGAQRTDEPHRGVDITVKKANQGAANATNVHAIADGKLASRKQYPDGTYLVVVEHPGTDQGHASCYSVYAFLTAPGLDKVAVGSQVDSKKVLGTVSSTATIDLDRKLNPDTKYPLTSALHFGIFQAEKDRHDDKEPASVVKCPCTWRDPKVLKNWPYK